MAPSFSPKMLLAQGMTTWQRSRDDKLLRLPKLESNSSQEMIGKSLNSKTRNFNQKPTNYILDQDHHAQFGQPIHKFSIGKSMLNICPLKIETRTGKGNFNMEKQTFKKISFTKFHLI